MGHNSIKNAAARAASAAVNKPVLKTKTAKTLKNAADQAVADATSSGADQLSLGELLPVRVADVVVEGRGRRDLDLRPLARSMVESGLAQPILLDKDLRLVAGLRRLRAAESLGWETIAARVVDIDNPLALAIAEDACRKDLNGSEKYAIYETVRERAKDEEYRRHSFGGRLETAEKKGRLDEEIGAALRLSRESLRKLKAVHDAAKTDQTKFGDLVAKLDQDGRVDRHFKELQKRQGRGDASRAAGLFVWPGWQALYERAEARDVARFVRESFLAAGADDGTVLLFPTSVESLGTAVGLVRQGGFEWRTTLRGSGAPGEDLWLIGAYGRKAEISEEAMTSFRDGCGSDLDNAFDFANMAFEGVVRKLDLDQLAEEAGA